jgi:hypothetical protein
LAGDWHLWGNQYSTIVEATYNRIPFLAYPKHRVRDPVSCATNRHKYHLVLIKETRAMLVKPGQFGLSVNLGNVTKEKIARMPPIRGLVEGMVFSALANASYKIVTTLGSARPRQIEE